MAVYRNGIAASRKLVLETFSLLYDKEPEDLRVREIAQAAGCSPAAIYRHFESADYLIVVASVRFLDEYLTEVRELFDSGEDMTVLYLGSWRLFNHHAFARPKVFYRFFWGSYYEQFERALADYCHLFPQGHPISTDLDFETLTTTADIIVRDEALLEALVQQGMVSREDAKFLSRSNPLIVRSMLLECMEDPARDRSEAERECNKLIGINFERVYRTQSSRLLRDMILADRI